ncbi:MAG: hypothetical protein AB1330_12440 [Bacillota bacterium]
MVLELSDIESFIKEAKEADAVRVYGTFLTEFPKPNGIPAYRVKFIVTALGYITACAAKPEKTLLRCTRDFGLVLEDITSRKMPESYHQKVEQKSEEIKTRLAEAGFELREGEITGL